MTAPANGCTKDARYGLGRSVHEAWMSWGAGVTGRKQSRCYWQACCDKHLAARAAGQRLAATSARLDRLTTQVCCV